MERFFSDSVQKHEIEHNVFVRENASECTLFLKRNGDFPVLPCALNLYGGGARRTLKGGKGSGDVNTRYSVSVEQGLINAGFTITTTEWLDKYDALAEAAEKSYWDMLEKEAEKLHSSPYALVMFYPKSSRIVCDMPLLENDNTNIYVVARESSEGFDRTNAEGDYLLTESEICDIRNLSRRKEKFLLVLNVGGVIDLSPIVNETENILLLSQLGAETGNVFADILTGKSMPSGKLTTTWAKNLSDYPSSPNFGCHTEVNYEEGIFVGYRYFDSFGVKPLFPFGFGLGYTDFSFTPSRFKVQGNIVCIEVDVENTGNYPGKEVIQAYCKRTGGDSPTQLVAFSKTKTLVPGEREKVRISFDITEAADYSEMESAFVLYADTYLIEIGNSVENTVCACSVRIEKDLIVKKVNRLTNPKIQELQCPFAKNKNRIPLLGEKICVAKAKKRIRRKPYNSDKTKKMPTEELARLCVGAFNDMSLTNNIGHSAQRVAGAAGETYASGDIEPLVLADGPAGLRLSPAYTIGEEGKIYAAENSLAGLLPGGAGKYEPKEGAYYYQFCTAIPVGTALAQSWNESLCEKIGNLVGSEMELFGVDVWLAPALNIHRHPLCGRNFEYYSEDPYLSGTIAAAVVNGVQSHPGCSVTIKHFCCNNQETDRFFSNSNVSERALREIYLKGFRICIEKSSPKALMSSYNLVNGTHTANSKELLAGVLREEWGYDGLVMTDWLSTGGMGQGEKYGPSSARECIAASNDLIMPGRTEDLEDISGGIKDNVLTRKNLEASVNRILCLAESKPKTEV